MENTKKSVQKTPSKLENVSNLVSKALTSRSKWDSKVIIVDYIYQILNLFLFWICQKDQYLDVVYWIRQVVGFIIGVFWGFLHFKGMFAIISLVLLYFLLKRVKFI